MEKFCNKVFSNPASKKEEFAICRFFKNLNGKCFFCIDGVCCHAVAKEEKTKKKGEKGSNE